MIQSHLDCAALHLDVASRQRNFHQNAHSCKHDSHFLKIALALNHYILSAVHRVPHPI